MSKFELGQIVATREVVDKVPETEIHAALVRHVCGDWGTVCEEDAKLNDMALIEVERFDSP